MSNPVQKISRMSPSLLLVSFLVLFVLYVIYSQNLVNELKEDEAIVSEAYGKFWATAFQEGRELEIIQSIFSHIDFPVVVINARGKPLHWENIGVPVDARDSQSLEMVKQIASELDTYNPPFTMTGPGGEKNFATVHYGESRIIRELRYMPYLQAAVIIVFAILAIWIIRYNLRSERKLIWVGMARESAHQLGTPLSSLRGWVELLRLREEAAVDSRSGESILATSIKEITTQMNEDLTRLTKIANRFELIGRTPRFQETHVEEILRNMELYFRARIPQRTESITLNFDVPDLPPISGNPELLEWAFENIIKNSIDALEGRGGVIDVTAWLHEGRDIHITVSDTGVGISKRLRKDMFKAGITTKERGWGVGLSLAKRIISDYHRGNIRLISTFENKGTVFLVTLPV
ncbi:MAG: PAS domain-containing sensor histidine kinase [Candidatus Glassbacteria bacterium]